MVERTCESCGNAFQARPYKIKAGKARFCGRACYRASVKREPKYCAGCGVLIPETGWHHEAKYCSQTCYHSREHGSHWKGGRFLDPDGYVRLWMPDHPLSRGHGYVAEHRLVVSQAIGRDLESTEVVHHINGIRDDNRIENLELLEDQAAHMRLHYGAL